MNTDKHRLQQQYWTGKSVLITGASSGLGWAITEALAPYRVHFCLLSRRTDPMQELVRKLGSSGSRFWIRACDVRNREQVELAVNDFVTEAGRIDAAWVNSGITGDTSFQNWDWSVVEQIIDTNVKGALYTSHACLRQMVVQGNGAIIAISSAAAMRGLPGRSIYSLTKIGLSAYMEAMAAELTQIQFTTIYPGFVDTPINQNNPRRFWLMTPESAAQLMLRAVAKGKCEYIYPFRMKLLFHLMRMLPAPLYRWVGHRMMDISRPQ